MKRSVLKRFLDACQSPLGCEADEKTGIPTEKAILGYSTIVATRPGSNILGEMGQIQNGILGRSPLLLSNSLELVRESSALETAERVFHELENFQINLIRWTKFGNCYEPLGEFFRFSARAAAVGNGDAWRYLVVFVGTWWYLTAYS